MLGAAKYQEFNMDSFSGSKPISGGETIRGLGAARTIRSLVLFSGGIDSTYSLVRLLRETRDRVYAHHVRFIEAERYAAQTSLETISPQVRVQMKWLRRHLRDFEYSQSAVDLSSFATRARENTSLMYFAAQAAMNYGFSPFDRILLGVNADTDPGWNPDSPVYAWRRTLLVRMLRSVWECDEVPHLYFWNPRPSKHAMLDYLPVELAIATFSCNSPVADSAVESGPATGGGPIPCGACSRCRWRARVSRLRGVAHQAGGTSTARTAHPYLHPEAGLNKMPALGCSA